MRALLKNSTRQYSISPCIREIIRSKNRITQLDFAGEKTFVKSVRHVRRFRIFTEQFKEINQTKDRNTYHRSA